MDLIPDHHAALDSRPHAIRQIVWPNNGRDAYSMMKRGLTFLRSKKKGFIPIHKSFHRSLKIFG